MKAVMQKEIEEEQDGLANSFFLSLSLSFSLSFSLALYCFLGILLFIQTTCILHSHIFPAGSWLQLFEFDPSDDLQPTQFNSTSMPTSSTKIQTHAAPGVPAWLPVQEISGLIVA